MRNILQMVVEPVEKFLDTNIDNGNIWFYIVGLIAIFLYFLIF